MREYVTFSIRIGSSGRSGEFRIGRNGVRAISSFLCLFFALGAHLVYDYRENLSRLRELPDLRRRVSEQNMTLLNLHAKFESIETEVERIRMLDARVRSLVKVSAPPRRGEGEGGRARAMGGSESPETAAGNRLDRLLDLRFDRLKESILVDVRNLEMTCEKLDVNRIMLECRPAFWPARGILSSGFGVRTSPFTEMKVFHHGVDIDAAAGAPVRAAAAGKVVRSVYEPLYGNVIVLDHGFGYRSLYGHLSERIAGEGDLVRKGEAIGKVGDTGRATGPHLHYEVHVNGLPVNPARFLN